MLRRGGKAPALELGQASSRLFGPEALRPTDATAAEQWLSSLSASRPEGGMWLGQPAKGRAFHLVERRILGGPLASLGALCPL